MSDITAANVLVTQTFKDESPGLCQNGDSLNTPSVSIDGKGTLTYPTYGISVPDLSQFRLKFGITRILISPPADGYFWIYDKTVRTANPVAPHGTFRAFALNGGAEMSGVVAAVVLDLIVIGA